MAGTITAGNSKGQKKPLPSAERLRKLLRLARGVLYWRRRPKRAFATARAFSTWNARYAGRPAGRLNRVNGYIYIRLGSANLLAHRVVFKMIHGTEPEQVDHVNGNKTDNRPSNLRAASDKLNRLNMPLQSNSTSGVPGVGWSKKLQRWTAQIKQGGKSAYLGSFGTFGEAVASRKAAERERGFCPNHGRQRAAA